MVHCLEHYFSCYWLPLRLKRELPGNQDFKSQEKRLNDDHFIHVYYHVHIKVKKIKLKLIKKTILKIYYCAAGIYSITDMCIKRVMAINFLSSNLWLALAKFKKKKPVF